MTDDWWEHRSRAMGSTVHVLGLGGPPDAGAAVPGLVDHLEQAWSRFRPDSELSALNADPAPEVRVTPDLASALRRALVAWDLTDGRFDPTVHDALVGAGYDRTFDEIRDGTVAPPEGTVVPGCAGVRVGPDCVVRPPGLRFDLGGIGKGLAADVVAGQLVGLGVRSVVVAVGGDVRVAGRAPVGGWRIPVADPFAEADRFLTVAMDEGAVVTSTTRIRRWQTADGGWAHHLIDPATGRPATSGVAAVVAVAAEAWWAEAVAKAALVAGEAAGSALLGRHGMQGWIVRDDTAVVAVSGDTDGVPAVGGTGPAGAAGSLTRDVALSGGR
jgi:FAD:protein FMN transferase